ncbi:MAG TPA: hydrogenase maturation nickel metallochaperone HypA [Planctomycetota bacterium]|nr:hydrogenase maturation nickel metallochaperone HypA [Planctomycetota bacterium]
MHELGLISEVLAIVEEESKGAPVKRIVLEVGPLACVLEDALRFAFELAREGTVAEAAELEIVRGDGATGDDELRVRALELV